MVGQYDKNCFHITHRTSSIIVCAIGFVMILTFLIILIAKPSIYETIFNIGLSRQNYIIIIAIFLAAFTIFNCFLAASLHYEGPALMMVWLIGNALSWNMYLILIIAVSIITSTRKKHHELYEAPSYVACRIICMLALLILWLIMIIKVGRHWFALCEEILQQMEEQERRTGIGARTGSSLKKRMRTMSMFSRYKKGDSEHGGHKQYHESGPSRRHAPSKISQRMPTFMQRFEKKGSERDRTVASKWENRPKTFEIERGSTRTAESSRRHSFTSERSLGTTLESDNTDITDKGSRDEDRKHDRH